MVSVMIKCPEHSHRGYECSIVYTQENKRNGVRRNAKKTRFENPRTIQRENTEKDCYGRNSDVQTMGPGDSEG